MTTAWLGIPFFIGLAWLMSSRRDRFPLRTVLCGVAIQIGFALLILRTSVGRDGMRWLSDRVTWFLDLADAGSMAIFGEAYRDHFFAFKVLPTIIFFSSFISVLYYFGVIQFVVRIFARVMMAILRTSGAESLSASANIFVGQTEAPLLIRPYVAGMTQSELMAVMTGGFATVAGGVLAAYVGMGVSAGHLIAASVMSAPAALVMAKIMIPETEVSKTAGKVDLEVEIPYVNAIDAAATGAADGLKLALNVGAMLLAFLALIAVINEALLGPLGNLLNFLVLSRVDFLPEIVDLDLETLLGLLFAPIAWIMGVPWSEATTVGGLLGIKTAANEFIGYERLAEMIRDDSLSERSQIIATYALCGFSNFSSIAIQIGGIGSIAPERKEDLARLGLRAMIAGTLACFQTASIAGILL
ncbi:MAG: NupC/NupG family nucleoside CNT transporter [Acidobacteria bacterium]|nr:MAG: NupC/NupG family nucleoside CNT transporter [Acidobacteriota bacterium]REK11799.1 MAG: NupC/NupG family nucleoside CNT transporter [Acidobacteriota bacterium]